MSYHIVTHNLHKNYIVSIQGLTFPKASRPLSKKRDTPRNVKEIPKPIRPKPTSANKLIKDFERI